MRVHYTCKHCQSEQAADVTDEVPTPSCTFGRCEKCHKQTFIDDEAIETWLDQRGFEVANSSKPKPFVKEVHDINDFIIEFTLVYQVHHRLASFQIGYYSPALRHFQKWVVEHGFDHAPKTFYQLLVSYNHKVGNAHYHANNQPLGYYGTLEAMEKGIAERMSWKGDDWLTRDNFNWVLLQA